MIYPKKISSKVSTIVIKSLGLFTIIIAIVLIIINKKTTPQIPWAAITNMGLIYIWITTIYSIRRNTNIAAHVVLQTVLISAVLTYIDKKFGYSGWSIYIGIPIIIMISNAIMIVLAIVAYKKYTKYTLYQIILITLSIIPFILVANTELKLNVLNIIATSISILNYAISLALGSEDFCKMLKCKFHM